MITITIAERMIATFPILYQTWQKITDIGLNKKGENQNVHFT